MRLFLWLAILPSIILARTVLRYDRIESEPKGLLIKLFVFGVLSCIPAGIVESIAESYIVGMTDNAMLISALTYLIVVPVAEEGFKYLALRTTRKHPAFNYTFDGIVYGTMVGLGFATFENILYVLDSMSLQVALLRGIFSVPMHCTCGIFMGYYYGVAKGLEVRGIREQATAARLLAFIAPCIIHGLYDFALDIDSWYVLIIGILMTLVVFIMAARQVRFASAHDTPIFVGMGMATPTPMPPRGEFHGEFQSKGTPQPPYGR